MGRHRLPQDFPSKTDVLRYFDCKGRLLADGWWTIARAGRDLQVGAPWEVGE